MQVFASSHVGALRKWRGASLNTFIGNDTGYLCADGIRRRRVYLDAAATTPMLQPAKALADAYLAHHANTHSVVHFGARGATRALQWAREQVLAFVNADPNEYLCLFVGAGATAALNRAAYYLAQLRPEATIVLASLMEHHANDLAHRRLATVEHLPLQGTVPALGPLDVSFLASRLRQAAHSVRNIAITVASNVTGIVNPIHDVCALGKQHHVPIVVDASQAVAHLPLDVMAWGAPDAVVFSGHKAYAPGSPGVLIVKRDLVSAAAPLELGGGMVVRVAQEYYTLSTDLVEREEAGTPNVYGAVALAGALHVLSTTGMAQVKAHERTLTETLVAGLRAMPGVTLYGDVECDRVGVVSFNIAGLDHGYIAAALNDYHAIAVRNECFCAHPYVRELMLPELWAIPLPDDVVDAEHWINRKRGMVRVSVGLHSTASDIDAFLAALREVVACAPRYLAQYRVADDGNYHHTQFVPMDLFDPASWLKQNV
jgi:cysteine desulfurase / selenocysteine lyase